MPRRHVDRGFRGASQEQRRPTRRYGLERHARLVHLIELAVEVHFGLGVAPQPLADADILDGASVAGIVVKDIAELLHVARCAGGHDVERQTSA